MDVDISMTEDEERFGFSVVGGNDVGLMPLIDDVSEGSPADRADLEIGDEIIEVNGHSLQDANHSEIIAHIHKCIQSRTIKLRVKRTCPGEKQIGEIQDAYVIAVEDEQQRRLDEKLSVSPLNHKQIRSVNLLHLEGDEPGESSTDLDYNGVNDYHIQKDSSSDNLVDNIGDIDVVNSVNDQDEWTKESSDIMDQENNHREMAIDCPKGFVGMKKEPPRLPSHLSPNRTPSKRRALENTTNFMHPAVPVSHEDEDTRIKRYQEDLRKRREEEERIQREQDFLRTSLRGSKKLQDLEEKGARIVPPSGIDNPNYVLEEEDEHSGKNSGATLPMRTLNYEGLIQQPLAVDDLFASVHRIQSRLNNVEDKEALVPIQQLLQNPRFQNAVYVHNKVVEVSLRRPISQAEGEAAPLVEHVQTHLPGSELSNLLNKAHMKALLLAHDRVAATQTIEKKQTDDDDEVREYLYERASQYGEESIKIVHINKTADPLGATVRNEGDSVIVGRIVKGGAAEASGLLHEGDEILEINRTDVRGWTVDDVCDLMAGLTGTLTFLIVPCEDTLQPEKKDDRLMHVRAHFDYDPEDDVYIPCRELGISFQKGDILHVIKQDDPCWWQAYRDGEEDQTLAGLIPSRSFMESREASKQTITDNEDEKKKYKCRCRCRHHKKKKKKQMYSMGEEADNEEILTYEEVVPYYPQPNRKRPIVLIGAPYVGRHELRQRLMESDPERFAAAVPYTTRPRKDDEIDGKHYHFVPRNVFEADITDHKFVEYGEYEKNLYGTSIEAIRTVVNSGKICVLNLHPQSLRILKNSDLKPYIVFVAPPNIERLKEIRMQVGAKMSDSDLKETIEKAREIEDSYGHYFDFIIVHYDFDRAYEELLSEINRLEVERQWVPLQWQQHS